MLKEAVDTTYIHFNRAKDNFDDIKNFSLDLTIYDDKEKIKTIDAFIFRFIKLQDFMGDKLFKEILKSTADYKDNMSLMDCLDKLEKLEIIENTEKWLKYRAVRNKLTHEYSTNQEDMVSGIALSLVYFEEIEIMLMNIIRYLKDKKLYN